MNKTLFITFLLLLLFTSCQKKKEEIQLPAKKVYVMAVHPRVITDGDELGNSKPHIGCKIVGLVEVSQNMEATIIRNEKNYFSDHNYFRADINLSDSIKKSLIRLTEECQKDTIFDAEEVADTYGGPAFFIVIEKKSGEHIFAFPRRRSIYPQYVDNVLELLLDPDGERMENIESLNDEKANEILGEKAKVIPTFFVPKSGIYPPPPPFKSTIKFIPPVILEDE